MDRRRESSGDRDRYRSDSSRRDDQRSREYYDYDRADRRERTRDSRDDYRRDRDSRDDYDDTRRSREVDGYTDRKRNRSRSPVQSNERKVHKDAAIPAMNPNFNEQEEPVNAAEDLDEDAQLAAFLGITGFASTKGQKVKGNEFNEAVDVAKNKKKREYRQYLYVKGSYDIPLTKDQLEASKDKEDSKRSKDYN